MIKFKKMSTFAKVGAIGIVTSVAGVAFIPVINKFIDNPKSKVHVYEFNHRLFKTKEAAEKARKKFTAMSGLIQLINSDKSMNPNIDYKPLMAEFVSFVSKLFTVKVFEMDKESATVNHFKYNGLTKEQKQDLLESEVAGEIRYGDLKDVTSLVKYATAHKEGNEWMFTPVDEMLLSILGDGSGQGYSLDELSYVELSKKIENLKSAYEKKYKDIVVDKIGGVSYALVKGVTHHNDNELAMADHEEVTDGSVNEGDHSGNVYDASLIAQFKQWGTLKVAFESAKENLNDFLSVNSINDEMKPVLLKLLTENAVQGWNNKERYSTEEIRLRDLIAKVKSESAVRDQMVVPGNHADTNINIVEGWNWSETGDGSDKDYEGWQLQLAEDIQNREKLLSMHIVQAPEGAVQGVNYASIGDGTGRSYDPSLFKLKEDFENINAKIKDLNTQIQAAKDTKDENGNPIKKAPPEGIVSPSGAHIDALGLGDGIDYSQSWAEYQQLDQLQKSLKEAVEAKTTLDNAIASTMISTRPDIQGGGLQSEDVLLKIMDFTAGAGQSVQGWNWDNNYNQEQVDYAKALAEKERLEKQIEKLQTDGIDPAPSGAVTNNLPPRGDESDQRYTQEQIELRDYKKQLEDLGATLDQAKHEKILRAPSNAILNPDNPDEHSEAYGAGDGQIYSTEFVNAARQYSSYMSKVGKIQSEIDDIVKIYPDLKINGESFNDMKQNGASVGVNAAAVFSVAEVKYSEDSLALKSAADALSDASKLFASLQGSVDAVKRAKLEDDYRNNVVPSVGENIKPTGDGTGKVYIEEDVKFHDAFEVLKKTFKDGNPWWADQKDCKSDEAYYALYNDWKAAIDKGTKRINTKGVGDGTDNQYLDAQFKTFNLFFKQSITDLHGSDQTKANKVESDLTTILNYLQSHGSLTTPGGYMNLNEKNAATSSTTRRQGDATGNVYLNIWNVHINWNKAYGYGSGNSYFAKLNKEKDIYNTLKNDIDQKIKFNDAQKLIDEAQSKINDYNTKLNGLKAISDPLETDYVNKLNTYDIQRHHVDDMVSRSTLKHMKEEDIIKLANILEKDNKAGTLSDELKGKLDELTRAKSELITARATLKTKKRVLNKLKEENPGFASDFSKLGTNLPVFGNNWVGSGDESDNSYTFNQITARDLLESIKEEVEKHFSSKAEIDAGLKKILQIKSNSEEGVNSGTKSGSAFGDTSGRNWEKWEIDQKMTIARYNGILVSLEHDKLKVAPDGANLGNDNHAPKGDRSGTNYHTSVEKNYIENFIPKYTKAKEGIKDANKDIEDLAKKISDINAMNIQKEFEDDPKVYFVDDKGNKTKQTDILKAKEILVEINKREALKVIKKAAETAKKQPVINTNSFIDNNANNLKSWNNTIKIQKSIQSKLSQKALDDEAEKVSTAQKAFDDADKLVKNWWETNKGKSVLVTKGSHDHGKLANVKISNDYKTFIASQAEDKSGSISHIYRNFGSANKDGRVNTYAPGKYTQEEIDLKNALRDFVSIPSGAKQPGTISIATYAFNTLLMMYQNAVNKGFEPKNYFWSGKNEAKNESHAQKISTLKTADGKHNFNAELYSSVHLTNHSAAEMVSFRDWITSTLHGNTLKVNHRLEGDGTGKTYPVEFFSNGKKSITQSDQITSEGFELGIAARTVSDFQTSHKKMTDNSILGPNIQGTGDLSGYTYTSGDILFYNAYKDQEEDRKDVDAKQLIVDGDTPKDDTVLQKTPVGYKGVGGLTHTDALGDGTGKTYTTKEIDDVRKYFAKLTQLKNAQQDIDDLKTNWENNAAPDKRTWAEVTTANKLIRAGYNHDVYWSEAEIKYDGDNIRNSDLLAKIANLESGSILDPKFAGSGTAPLIKITPAPNGALVGMNNSIKGLGTGEQFEMRQIVERDEIRDVIQAIAVEESKISAFKAKGVIPAPTESTVAVSLSDWHPEKVGDASGKFYPGNLFDDKYKIQGAQYEVYAKQQELDAFKSEIGESAIQQIIKQYNNGMVDGVNNEVRYSTIEIGYRDNSLKLIDAIKELALLEEDSRFKRMKLLTEDSVPYENVKLVGLGNNLLYSQQEINFRELCKRIQKEEIGNGIKSEEEIVSYTNLFSGNVISSDLNVREYYGSIDLIKAVVGENHGAHGDETNAHYTKSDLSLLGDIVSLESAINDNQDEIAHLMSEGVKPAPSGEKAISSEDTYAKVEDYGKHKTETGDKSGKSYNQLLLDQAAAYKVFLDNYNKADAKLKDFINDNKNEVDFFKVKMDQEHTWLPVVGRNWTSMQFELKAIFDQREALNIGRTMINMNPDLESKLGINNGHLESVGITEEQVVIYKGDDDKISEELLGSDKVRIGYVLKTMNEDHTNQINAQSPVLSSLEMVANYLQKHEELAPDNLIEKFAALDNMGVQDTNDIYKITEDIVSKDKFNAMASNFEWGDE